jgi:hypothetical protein
LPFLGVAALIFAASYRDLHLSRLYIAAWAALSALIYMTTDKLYSTNLSDDEFLALGNKIKHTNDYLEKVNNLIDHYYFDSTAAIPDIAERNSLLKAIIYRAGDVFRVGSNRVIIADKLLTNFLLLLKERKIWSDEDIDHYKSIIAPEGSFSKDDYNDYDSQKRIFYFLYRRDFYPENLFADWPDFSSGFDDALSRLSDEEKAYFNTLPKSEQKIIKNINRRGDLKELKALRAKYHPDRKGKSSSGVFRIINERIEDIEPRVPAD